MKRSKKLLALVVLTLVLLISAVPTFAAGTMKLNATKVTTAVAKPVQLKVLNKGTKKVTWRTSNKAIATVSSTGVVKGVKAGSCKVSATVGTKKFYCAIVVQNNYVKTSKNLLDPASYANVKPCDANGNPYVKILPYSFIYDKNGVMTVKMGVTNLGFYSSYTVKTMKITVKYKTLTLATGRVYFNNPVVAPRTENTFSARLSNGLTKKVINLRKAGFNNLKFYVTTNG